MKGNDGTGNKVDRDDWETPQWLFDKLNDQYKFEFDCCATENNSKCRLFSSNLQDNKGIPYISWMNPPFSKADIMIKHFFKIIPKGVAIYRIDNIESYLWHFILNNADWVFIIRGRINYEGHKGKGSRFGSALFGVGLPPPKDIEGVALKRHLS